MERTVPKNLLDSYDQDAVTRALASELRTTHAIFFHQRKDTLAMTTAHTVETDADGVPVVGPGHPLTPEDEQAVLDLLMSRDQQAAVEILPPTILYRDRHTTMWWLPPLVRPMFLRTHDDGLKAITTRWPSLVALVRDRTLHLVAVEGDARPTAESPIYHSPLPNVHGDSVVCTGSARLPLAARICDLPAWESVVFDTAFTHANHTATLRAPKPAAPKARGAKRKPSAPPKPVHADAAYWAKRDGETQPFPDGSLNPLGLTLAQWLPALSGAPDRRAARRGRN